MKLTGFLKNISRSYTNDKINITLEINEEYEFRKINTEELKNKLLDINLSRHKNKRSNNTNKYMWQLISKLAQKRDKSTEEIYREMLEKYGQSVYIIVKKEKIDTMLRCFKYCKVLGDVTVGKEKGVQLKCFYGTSKYTSEETKELIKGITKECRKDKIDTMTPSEIKRVEEMLSI